MMAEETSSVASIDNLLHDLDEMIAFEDSGEVDAGGGDGEHFGEAQGQATDAHHHEPPPTTDVEPTVPFQSSTSNLLGETDGEPSVGFQSLPQYATAPAPVEASYESFAIDTSFDGSELSTNDEKTEKATEQQQQEKELHVGDDIQKEEAADAFEKDSTTRMNNNGENNEIEIVNHQNGVRPRLGRWFSGSRSRLQAEQSVQSLPAEQSVQSLPDSSGDGSEPPQPSVARRGLGRYAQQVSASIRNLRETAAALDTIQASKVKARTTAMDPHSFITSPNAKARTLSISDHHATILLIRLIPAAKGGESDTGGEPMIIRALLKLSLAPFHKMPLGRKPMTASDYFDQKFSADDEKASSSILWFLSNYSFSMASDSGAEFSYYDAVPAQSSAVAGQNRVAGEVGLAQSLNMALHGLAGESPTSSKSTDASSNGPSIGLSDALMLGGFKVEFIAPATDQQIRKEMPKPSSSLVQETPDLYDTVTRPYIDKIFAGNSLDWIEDIVKGRTNTNGILFETADYFLHIDTLWKNHPDPRAVPLEDWFEHSCVSDLHIIGMLKADGISSLRDLRDKHVPLLKSMLDEGLRMIHQVYGLDSDQVRVYVPYPPQFYRFHVYYTRIDHIDGCLTESAHLVHDIIQNLEMDGQYYEKRTITCKIRVTDDLYKRVWMHEVSKESFDDDDLDLDVGGDY